MAGIFRRVGESRSAPRRNGTGTFRMVSRTDGKTGGNVKKTPPEKKRSGPKRCPICGTCENDHPGLFQFTEGRWKCTVCSSKIERNGNVIVGRIL